MALLNPWTRRLAAGKKCAPTALVPQLGGVSLSALVLFAVCALLSVYPLAAESHQLTEYEIKAGFLFNFTKFVEWPASAFASSSAPIVLGIVGDNPFGNLLLETVAGKTVNGRPVLVRQFKEGDDLRSCHVLFVGSKDKKRMAQTLTALKGASILTVGEGSAFTYAGGMIAYLVEGNRVRLEIDLGPASEAHLKISAKVIAVARLVEHDGQQRN